MPPRTRHSHSTASGLIIATISTPSVRSIALLAGVLSWGAWRGPSNEVQASEAASIWLESYQDKKLTRLSELTKGRVLLVVAQERCAACDDQIDSLIRSPSAEFSPKVVWVSDSEKPRRSWIGKIPIYSGDARTLQEIGKGPISATPTHLVYCNGRLLRQEAGSAPAAELTKWFQAPECR